MIKKIKIKIIMELLHQLYKAIGNDDTMFIEGKGKDKNKALCYTEDIVIKMRLIQRMYRDD